jgi:hypothetical protein
MSRAFDRDLEDLFDDRELLETAYFLKSSPQPEPALDPAFRMALRRELMQRAAGMAQPRRSWFGQLFAPPALAWGGAAAAAVLVAVVAAIFYAGPAGQTDVQVASALDNATNVGLVQPIPVVFNQPMDHVSTEAAVTIEPATKVTYTWQGNTMLVQPVSGNLAPNTQYVVHVGLTARTAEAKPLAEQKTITFVTQTPPTPRPSPRPSPQPTAPPAIASAPLAQLPGTWTWTAWSPDGGTLYVLAGGQLSAVPASGGAPRPLVGDAIRIASLAPDGSKLAYVRNGHLFTVGTDGSGATDVGAADAVAIGWRQSRVMYMQGNQVFLAGSRIATLANPPTSAWFSPSGERLLYSVAAGTHLVDAAGKDTDLKNTIVPLAWSPDGRRAVWVSSGSLVAGDPASSPAATLAPANGFGPDGAQLWAGWSRGDDILVAGAAGVWTVRPDGGGLRKLEGGIFAGVTWAEDASHVAFVRGQALWTGVVSGSAAPQPAAASPDKVVGDFMAARVGGDATAAQAFLDRDGRQAYGAGANLTWSGEPRLHRYYTILAEPLSESSYRYVVRLVLARDGLDVAAVDETLTLQADSNGKLLIHSASAGSVRQLGKGPEVVLVELVDSTHLRVTFDSDLQPAVAQAVQLRSNGHVVTADGSYADRVLTFTLARPLEQGTSYRLVVSVRVRDVSGRAPQAEYDLDFVTPAAA